MKKFAKLLTFAVVLTALIVATLTVGISASESGGSTTTSTPLSGTPTAFWHVDGTTLYITGSAGEDGVLTGGAKNSTDGQDWTSVRTTVTEVKIEATGVTTLSEGFFSYLTAVTKITIPSTVNTFLGGWQMFSACDNLATLDAGNNFGNGVIDVSNITSMGYGNLSYTFNNTKPVIVLNPNLTFNTSATAFGALGRTGTAEVAVVVNTEKGAISDFVKDIIADLRAKSGVTNFPKAIVASQSLNITGTLPDNADFAWSYNLRDNVITITGEGTAIAHETAWKYWGNAGTMGAEVAKRATKILVECPNLTAIGSRTFGNFASVTEIAIPETVTKIGSEVFRNSPNISKVYTMHYDATSETWSNNDAQDNVIDLSNITVYGESGQSGTTAFSGAFKNASVTLKLADDFTVYDYSGNAYKKEFTAFGSYIDGATSYMEIYVANPSTDVQTILNATLNAKGTTPGSYADAIDYRVGGAVPYITEGNFTWEYSSKTETLTIRGADTKYGIGTTWINTPWAASVAGALGNRAASEAKTIRFETPNVTAIGGYSLSGFTNVTTILLPDSLERLGGLGGYELLLGTDNLTTVGTIAYNDGTGTWGEPAVENGVIDFRSIPSFSKSVFSGAFNSSAAKTIKFAEDFAVYENDTDSTVTSDFTAFGSKDGTGEITVYVRKNSTGAAEIDIISTLGEDNKAPNITVAYYYERYISGTLPGTGSINAGFTWTYDKEDKILTITGDGTAIKPAWRSAGWTDDALTKNGGAGEGGALVAAEAVEIVLDCPNLTSIGSYTFMGFQNVTKITIPKTVTTLGGYAVFNGTPNLVTVEAGNNTGDGIVDLSNITTYGSEAGGYGPSPLQNAFANVTPTIYFAEEFVINSKAEETATNFSTFGSSSCTKITVYVKKGSTGETIINATLSNVAAANKAATVEVLNYPYVPGNPGFTWTYDETTKILTISGSGTAIANAWRTDGTGWTDALAGTGGANACANAEEIVLDCPNLTSIGAYTFMGFPKVTKITIPKSVTTLGSWSVFHTTPNLVTIDAGNNKGDGIIDLSNITAYEGKGTFSKSFSANVTPVIHFAETFEITTGDANFSSFGVSDCTKITAYVKKGSAGETIITKTAAIAAANRAATVEIAYYYERVISGNVPVGTGKEEFTWSYDQETKILTISGEGTNLTNAWRTDGTGWTDAIAGTGGANACANAEEIVLDCPNLTSIGAYTFMGFPKVTKITIPKSVTTLGSWSVFHTTPNLVTIDAGNNKGDGIIDLSNITVYEGKGTFSTSFSANVTPVIHFAETFEITTGDANFSSFGAPECTQITAYVHIGSTGEDIIEATVENATAKAESVVVKCYRETVTGTITQATDFSWTFDTDTGVMVISSSTGTKISNTWSKDYEAYHWNEIKNYVKKITFDTPKLTYIGTYAFGGLTNLEEIVLPATVTKLGNYGVFHQCDNLRTVWTYGGERTVGVIDLRNMVSLEGGNGNQTSETDLGTFAGAFASVSGLKIYLPDDLGAKITKGWNVYTTGEFTVYVTEDSAAAAVVNNANKPSTITVKYYVTIDSGLSSIGWQVKVGSSAVNGLRGVLSFDTAAIEKNKTSGYTLVEIGTVYGTDANAAEGLAVLDTGTPNEGGKATRFVPANDNLGKVAIYWDGGVRNNYLSYKNGILQFCVALTNIPVAQADTDFRMAAYSIWVDDNGEYIYEYCDVSSRALSIYDVTLGLTKYGTINSDSVTAGSTIHSAILDTGKVTTGNLDSTGTLNATYTLYQDKLEGGIVAVIRGSGETPLLAFEGAPYCADYEVSTIVIDTGITKINRGLIDASTTALYYSNDLAAIECDSLIFRGSGQTTADPYWSNMVVVSPARTEENCGDNAGSAGEYGLWDVSGVTTVNGSRNFQRTAATTLHLPAQIDIQNYMFSANGNLTTVWCGDNEAQTGVIDLSNVTPSTIVENNPEWTLGNGTFSWMNSNITKVILPDGLPKDYALQMSGNYYIQDESAEDGYSIKTGEKISLFENSTCVVVSDEEIPAITEYLIGFVNGKVYSKKSDGTYAVGNHHNVSSYVKKGTDGTGAGETFFAPVFNRLQIGGTALNSYQIYSNGLADEAKELQDAIYARHSVKLTVTDTVPSDRYIKIEKTLTDDSGFTISLDASNNIIITGPQTGMWIGYAIEYFAYEFVIPVSYDPVSVDALDISSKFSSQIIPFASAVYTKNTLSATLQAVYADSSVCIIGQQVDSKGVNNTLNSFLSATGEKPGMIGIDLTPYGFNIAGKTYSEVRQFKKELVAYAKAGGIINVSIHFTNPSGIKTDEEYNHCRGSLGNYSSATQYENVYQALYTAPTSESTELQRTIYENFNAELELFAEFLGELKYNGVPVLYRPLHEMNGNWFWWGIGQRSFIDTDGDGLMDVDANGVYEVTNTYWINPEYYKNLYRHVYNYFTNTCGLDNILWVYAPDISSNSNYDASTCYPGDDFVDIAGVDWYTDVPGGGALEIDTTGSYNKLFGEGGSATSKIGAITEFGPRNNANYAWLVGQYGSDTGTWEDGLYLGDKQSDYYSCVDFYEDLMALKDKGYSFAYTLSWINQWSVMKMGEGWTFMEKGYTLGLEEVAARLGITVSQ